MKFNPADLNAPSGDVIWEWRVFWPPDSSLQQSPFDFSVIPGEIVGEPIAEKNVDTYILIPRNRINLKLREDRVSYKLISSRKGMLNGYSKKKTHRFPINPAVFTSLTGVPAQDEIKSAQQLTETIMESRSDTKIVTVEKYRNTLDFKLAENGKSNKTLSAEYSSLMFDGRTFGTLCLESDSSKFITSAIQHINIGDGRLMDYIDFLSLLASGRL